MITVLTVLSSSGNGLIPNAVRIWLMIANQLLTASGHSVIPIDDATVTNIISTGFTVATALASWWKNNDFTHAAKKGTELTKSLKNGDSVQVVKASDSDHEFTEGGE